MSRCAPPLYRKRQTLAKVEVNCGVAETITATDGAIRVTVSPTVETNATLVERDIARATLSGLPSAVGEKMAGVKFSHELAGSGSATTPPECGLYLRACMMAENQVDAATIGAVTGGPFERGEEVTNGTGGVGRVVLPTADGDANIYFVVTAGSFASADTLTGTDSAAEATLSAEPAQAGYSYTPKSSNFETLTIRNEEDGYQKTTIGAMGTFELNIESSNYGKIDFDFSGAVGVYGDQALTAGVVFPTTIPPILQSADLVLDRDYLGEFVPVFRNVGLQAGNDVTMRKDGNAESGLIAAIVTGRAPKMTLSPEMMLASEFDIFNKLFDADVVTIGFKLGRTTNNIIHIYARETQVESLGDTEQDSVAGLDVNLRLNSQIGDSEYEIVFI